MSKLLFVIAFVLLSIAAAGLAVLFANLLLVAFGVSFTYGFVRYLVFGEE